MQDTDELRLEILRLKNELIECKAAIKDAIYSAENTPWKKWWIARYSYLLGLYNVIFSGRGFLRSAGRIGSAKPSICPILLYRVLITQQ